MSAESAVPQAKEFTNPLNVFGRWLKPRSQDRDEAFRERSLRIALALMITLATLSFVLGVVVYQNPWGLISAPSLNLVGIGILATAGYLVSRGQITQAAWVVLITILVGAAGALVILGQTNIDDLFIIGIPLFLLVVVLASLILPRSSIWRVTLISMLLYGVSVLALQAESQGQQDFDPLSPILTALLLTPLVAAILHRLRVEFDARLAAMRESIQQEELARKQAEEARQQADVARQQAEADRKRAEEADKAKSQFLANMSHELRTPLNAIIGYDEAMLGGMVGEFAPNQSKLLGHIQHNSRRLLSLINDILDLSKIESGSVPVFLSPMSPHKVIQETLDSLRSLADEKKIALTAQFSDAVPEVVLGDTNKLQQVLVNLVSNAIKFTDQGSVTVNVSVVDSTRWIMEVRDTGIGMPADALNTIFEPFQQIDSTDKRKYKGTGLGLAITKRLVESLAGKIEVKSKLGEGSTFSVTLPRAHVPEAAIKPTETATKEIAS
jgi:signal transduction histidine kinase